MRDNLVSNALFKSLVVRVATAYLEEDEDTATHTADMSNGVLPTSKDKQRNTRSLLKRKNIVNYKRNKGKLKPKSRVRMKKLRRKGPAKKYIERTRETPKKVERRDSGGKKHPSDYKKNYDWSADNKKRKEQKAEWEKKPSSKKTRKKNYEKNKNKAKNK
tara:strand:- start:85 stop:564 length:480 start_codon:yes stop_codon:yes gene_type:complete